MNTDNNNSSSQRDAKLPVMPRELYIEAINKWGAHAQIMMAVEEFGELLQALSKEWRGKKSNIEEEIADAEIMLEQIKLLFDKGGVEIHRSEKLKRLDVLLHGA